MYHVCRRERLRDGKSSILKQGNLFKKRKRGKLGPSDLRIPNIFETATLARTRGKIRRGMEFRSEGRSLLKVLSSRSSEARTSVILAAKLKLGEGRGCRRRLQVGDKQNGITPDETTKKKRHPGSSPLPFRPAEPAKRKGRGSGGGDEATR
ncbi:hypothetical protein BRADI_3g28995v3 [Brachypodium distachyon]|uniref:Uncharacterized protein n=1 Tax=Brachypodium distachyon TaxID=15368 RepID=A0A0Q3JFN5_BRADI|nr:hypothetical protein BRADI_3g28995v3 [Brachypodium distachyon]PNT67568.1 hypothetical protein BRADI_3g28995v3 [Brachypodium distachyon]